MNLSLVRAKQLPSREGRTATPSHKLLCIYLVLVSVASTARHDSTGTNGRLLYSTVRVPYSINHHIKTTADNKQPTKQNKKQRRLSETMASQARGLQHFISDLRNAKSKVCRRNHCRVSTTRSLLGHRAHGTIQSPPGLGRWRAWLDHVEILPLKARRRNTNPKK